MAAEDEAAFEGEQKVLSARLDADEPPAVQPVCDPEDGRARMRCLDLHRLADESLEPPRGAMEGIAFGHREENRRVERARAAAAGATAATVWGLLEPLDKRLFRCDYSDVALLGKLVTRGPGWRAAGFALHAANGAAFGLVFDAARRRLPIEPRRLALVLALAEHVALYPTSFLVDRYHPARGTEGIPPLLTNPRAFAQATARHALFGWLLGRLA